MKDVDVCTTNRLNASPAVVSDMECHATKDAVGGHCLSCMHDDKVTKNSKSESFESIASLSAFTILANRGRRFTKVLVGQINI